MRVRSQGHGGQGEPTLPWMSRVAGELDNVANPGPLSAEPMEDAPGWHYWEAGGRSYTQVSGAGAKSLSGCQVPPGGHSVSLMSLDGQSPWRHWGLSLLHGCPVGCWASLLAACSLRGSWLLVPLGRPSAASCFQGRGCLQGNRERCSLSWAQGGLFSGIGSCRALSTGRTV